MYVCEKDLQNANHKPSPVANLLLESTQMVSIVTTSFNIV